MRVAQGQDDGFNRKSFIVVRSLHFEDASILKQLNAVYILEKDMASQTEGWEAAYLFFAKWHRN